MVNKQTFWILAFIIVSFSLPLFGYSFDVDPSAFGGTDAASSDFMSMLQGQSQQSQQQNDPFAILKQQELKNSLLIKLSIPAFIVKKYLSKNVSFLRPQAKKYDNCLVSGFIIKEGKYCLVSDGGIYLEVQFDRIGSMTPSNRLGTSGVDTQMQYQLYMQQMLSQALNPVMENDMSGYGSSLSDATLPLQQSLNMPQQNPVIIATLEDAGVMYYDKDSAIAKRGIPDYISNDYSIVLKDGSKLKERFVQINENAR